MKCQEFLKYISIRNSILAIMIAGAANTHASYAAQNIDSMSNEIAHIITQRGMSPKEVIFYDDFKNGFEELLLDFLSLSNNESLAAHVAKFDAKLTDYRAQVVDNPAFCSVKHLTCVIHGEFVKLSNILRKHIGRTGKHMELLKAIEPFKHMVPSSVEKRINGALIACLRNRMKKA